MLQEGLRFEIKNDASQKFWEPVVTNNLFTARYGRIDTTGQLFTVTLPSPEAALSEYQKRTRQKLLEGYKPPQDSVWRIKRSLPPVDSPKGIQSVCIGEHVDHAIASDLSGWLTASLYFGVSAKQMTRLWEKLEEGDEALNDTLGISQGVEGATFWEDRVESKNVLPELYSETLKRGGDRFTWTDQDAFVYIVSLRGVPSEEAIINTAVNNCLN